MTAKGDPSAPVPGTTLGQGFRLMAQALLEIAQQLKISNQLQLARVSTPDQQARLMARLKDIEL